MAVVFQLLCFSCSHNDVALGAWRDRVRRQLQLSEDVTYPVEIASLSNFPTPRALGMWYADSLRPDGEVIM